MKGEGTINYWGVEIDIEYWYEPLVRGRMFMDNGDPGYPDEGGEFYIEKAFIGDQDVTELLEDKLEDIATAYYEKHDGVI